MNQSVFYRVCSFIFPVNLCINNRTYLMYNLIVNESLYGDTILLESQSSFEAKISGAFQGVVWGTR